MMSNRSRDDFDRLMTSWMEADSRVQEPAELLDRVLDRTRDARRRPRWLVPEWWLPMQTTLRLQAVSRPVPFLFLLGAMLIVLALVAILIGGSQRKVPAPFGPAGNGQLLWDANAAIYTSNADGSGVRTVVTNIPNAAAPTVSSDGLRVAFWGDGSPDSLFVANVDGSSIRKLAGNLWIGTDKSPAWSPDSRRLAISTESGPDRRDESLVVFDVVTGDSTTLSRDAVGGSRAFRPTWSPDGEWIGALAIDANDRPGGYWIFDPDGSGARQLATSRVLNWAIGLSWAPSTRPLRVAYTAEPAGERASLVMVFDLTTGTERRVSTPDTEAARWPAWSPDASRLAWFGGPTGTAIIVTDLADPSHTTSLPAGTLNSPFAWSPDGRFLYGLNAMGTSLIVIPLDGSKPVEIPHAASQGLPDWQRVTPSSR